MEVFKMANYDEIKKKAKEALETIADVSVEALKIAEEKAKVLAKRAKLNAEITHEKSVIRRLKLEIGGVYYDLHKDDPEEALKQNCEAITASLDKIAAKRVEIEDLKRTNQSDSEEAGECESESESECECAEPATKDEEEIPED